jgi:7-keto-8-aminopelargonate synthetase-like enzyme
LCDAAEKYGISPSGSRTTTGNHSIYCELEESIADFLGAESAVILSSGYLANTILLEGIKDNVDRFFLDEISHASLMMAAKLIDKPIHFYKHIDSESLKTIIEENIKPGEIPFVGTDGVFPARGEIPPLKEYEKIITEYGGKILLDDSHAIALIGSTGKGSWEMEHVSRKNVHQTSSMSKGLGMFGGVVADTETTIRAIKGNSNSFCGGTAIPIPIAAAVKKSISLLKENPSLIQNLQKKSMDFKLRLSKLGLYLPVSPSPIVSVSFFNEGKNNHFKNRLIEEGIYPSFSNYPGSPEGGHFRFAFSSQHTREHINKLYDVIESSL